MSSRRPRRFFTYSSLESPGDIIFLSASETEHLKRVLRLQEGEVCLLTSSQGTQAEAVIEQLSGGSARLRVDKLIPKPETSQNPLVFIYPALIQRGKMDELVRPLQELGIQGFLPVETERSILKLSGEAKQKVSERWEKIVQEAAKQSGSSLLMHCSFPQPLEKALAAIPEKEQVICFHPGASVGFSSWIKSLERQNTAHLFFGPEGGFSDREIGLMKSRKAVLVRLTEPVLKADTAILGVAAAVKFLFS